MLYVNEILSKCEEKGYKISKQGLYNAGIKNGFLIKSDEKKSDGRCRWDFDQSKFLEWLNKAVEEIPEGWVTLKEASEILNVSIAQMYLLVKHENSGAKYFGAGKGIMYVDPKRIEEIIKNNKAEHHYVWEDEDESN